tara:strand:- start:1264 stop:1701 length:438 start_codon:yes stop_codon:yes gene_type:complete
MAITYDKISYDEIEQGLKSKIAVEFQNVYISPSFVMRGTECIRINLVDSTSEELATNFEVRNYNIVIRYYIKAKVEEERINSAVKGKIDRLRKLLIDNQINTGKNWSKLEIDTITYHLQDEENEDISDLNIAEFDCSILHYNQFT